MRSVRRFHRRTIVTAGLCLVVGLSVTSGGTPLLAHDDFGAVQSPYQKAYQDFLFGMVAVVSDTPVALGLIAAGLFAGTWKPGGSPSLWFMYLGGIAVGAAVGFSAAIPPALPAYFACIAVGLLGAAALKLPIGVMRGTFFVVGAVFANAMLSGVSVSEIPVFDYVGMAVALNLGVLAPAGLVAVSHKALPYGWVPIAWRAAMSWIVAIALMALVLMMKSTPY